MKLLSFRVDFSVGFIFHLLFLLYPLPLCSCFSHFLCSCKDVKCYIKAKPDKCRVLLISSVRSRHECSVLMSPGKWKVGSIPCWSHVCAWALMCNEMQGINPGPQKQMAVEVVALLITCSFYELGAPVFLTRCALYQTSCLHSTVFGQLLKNWQNPEMMHCFCHRQFYFWFKERGHRFGKCRSFFLLAENWFRSI